MSKTCLESQSHLKVELRFELGSLTVVPAWLTSTPYTGDMWLSRCQLGLLSVLEPLHVLVSHFIWDLALASVITQVRPLARVLFFTVSSQW